MRLPPGFVYLTVGGVLIAACTPAAPITPEPTSSTVAAGAPLAARPHRGGEMQALTAAGIIDEIAKAGLPAPNALDTTAQDCPAIGCDQSIVTDTVAVKSFAGTGQAEQYAAPRGLYQVETVVVSFAPPVPESERQRYRAEILKLVH
jgi:hypothetical protein